MIPGEFEYHSPSTVQEAVSLLEKYGYEAKILAGGQSLIPAMRFRLAMPEVLIDINNIEGLAYLRESNGHLAIGAMTREVDLEESPLVTGNYHLLADASRVIADPLVRNRATVGGNVAHADPANDHPAVMLAYDAEFFALGPNGTRAIAVDDFFVGLFESALAENEILTEIRVPRPAPGSGEAYVKLERKVGDYAISAVAVRLAFDGQVCTEARIALTNVSPVPMRAMNAEHAIIGRPISEQSAEAAGRAAAAECDPSPDLRGSVEYKRDLTRVLTKRAIYKAEQRARGA